MSKESAAENLDQRNMEASSKVLENGGFHPKKEDEPQNNQDQTYGSLGDLYFSESAATLDTNSDSSQASPSAGVMTDRVQRVASNIYAEFKAMIEAYGLPVVERLMPLVVGLLENLDEVYKDQAAYHEEVYQLREQNGFMIGELEREKDRRKQAELRLIHVEDAFDEERKTQEAKVEALTLNSRQVELKYQNLKDQFARMEAKEVEWKKESQRLHEHINELIRSKLDLADQIKFANQSSTKSPTKANAGIRPGSSNAPTFGIVVGLSGDGDTAVHSGIENMYDATSGGFGFDEMPSSDAEGVLPDEEIPDDSASPPIATADNDTGAFAGMRREIDILIKENMELVETKDALNVVKDDLIAKLDSLNLENASLRESVSHLTRSRSTLQSELASTDQLLNDTRHELEELRDRLAVSSHRFESSVPESDSSSVHRKRFTRAEMARVLSERNQYKERLMELQEAVHLTETLRAGQKGHPELLLGLSAAATSASGTGGILGSSFTGRHSPAVPANRPLQTLQNFFAALIAPGRGDSSSERLDALTAENLKLRRGVSHSWVCLSRARASAPIYGWSRGLDSPVSKRSPSAARSNSDITNAQSQTVPLPVQCRSIGGLRGNQLEIAAALLVTLPMSDMKDAKSEHQIWLIGRGPGHSGPTASPNAGGRGFVGQVLVFELSRFSQPLHTFDLDNGFMPTAAVFVRDHPDRKKLSSENSATGQQSKTEPSVQFDWEILQPDANSLGQSSAVGNVILASNDGRFLVLQVVTDLRSLITKASESGGSTIRSVSWLAVAQFHVQSVSLVSNFMVSTGGLVCLSLSDPSGKTHLNVFRLADALNTTSTSSSLGKNTLTHQLLTIPGDCAATGPVVMALDTFLGSDESPHVWLGTAGGGYCHGLNLITKQFVQSLRLPHETPCLHTICVQPRDTADGFDRIWLAVSGTSSANVDGSSAIGATETDANRGMARLIAFRADTQTLMYQIDLTTPLCAMIDTEGVTDPIDLTVCRLLLISDGLNQSLWFATRSGIIGRFPVPAPGDLSDACIKPHVPNASALTVSCHAYRRPVCSFLSVKIPGSDERESEQFVIAFGHDDVNLWLENPRSPPRESKNQNTVYRLRRMGSGAHTTVWKLNVLNG